MTKALKIAIYDTFVKHSTAKSDVLSALKNWIDGDSTGDDLLKELEVLNKDEPVEA